MTANEFVLHAVFVAGGRFIQYALNDYLNGSK